jgi:maltose alpha-D-glucosyltransferase/alpha-amylase
VQWTEVVEQVPVRDDACLTFVRVEYTEGEAETYVVPLALGLDKEVADLVAHAPQAVLARVHAEDGAAVGVLYDPLWERVFCEALLGYMVRKPPRGTVGQLAGWSSREIRRPRDPQPGASASMTVVDQATTAVLFGTRFILRVLRVLEPGIHPALEVGEFLTERARFTGTPPLLGALQYQRKRGTALAVATLHAYVPHEGDAWRYTLDELGRYFERVLSGRGGSLPPAPPPPAEHLVERAAKPIPALAREMVGGYLQSAALMGRRIAELHLALASDPADPAFAPEPFSELYQRSVSQSMRNLTRQSLQNLRARLRVLPEADRAEAQRLVSLEGEILRRARSAFQKKFTTARTRYHGSLHLGQLLYTGKDFVILMSEGEAARSAADRRVKRSPLRDVASMLRSIHYAAAHEFSTGGSTASVRREDLPALDPWARFWRTWVSAAFLQSYLATAGTAPFVPQSPSELSAALDTYQIEKALNEIGYELEMRPDWARIPIHGILELVG